MRCPICLAEHSTPAPFRLSKRVNGQTFCICKACAGKRSGDATKAKHGADAKPRHKKRLPADGIELARMVAGK